MISTYLRSRDFPLGPTTPHHPESTNGHDVRRHNRDLPTAPMPKVKETRTQDHLREKVTHLNLHGRLPLRPRGYCQGDRRAQQLEDQLRYEL